MRQLPMNDKQYFYFVECSLCKKKFKAMEHFIIHVKYNHKDVTGVSAIEYWLDNNKVTFEEQ
jgi:hypothetical protein